MSKTEFQTDQIVNNNALPVTRQPANTNGDALLAAIDQNFDSPMRLYASNPSDALLHFQAQQFSTADGTGKSIPPISSQIPAVVTSTVNFQTQATTGATFVIPWPATDTVGNFLRMGFTLLSSGTIQALVSASSATLAGLANAGTVFINGGIPLGWIDLQCTSGTAPVAYKTAGSTTSIIENAVAAVPRIVNFGSGGGGSGGTGDQTNSLNRLEDWFNASPYQFMSPSVFKTDGATYIASATASFDIVNQWYLASIVGQTVVASQLFDTVFLSQGIDVAQVEAILMFDSTGVDTNPGVGFSRDGGVNYFPMTMARIGLSDSWRATLTISTDEASFASLYSYAVTSTGNLDLTASGSAGMNRSMPFTVAASTYQVLRTASVNVNKVGSPSGNLTFRIVRDNGSGLPSALPGDILSESAFVPMSGIASGASTVTANVPLVALIPGAYHLVIWTDLAYENSYVAATTLLQLKSTAVGSGGSFNGTAWSTTANSFQYAITGRALIGQLKYTAGTANAKFIGFGVAYNFKPGVVSGLYSLEVQSFLGSANQNVFTLTKFLPDPDLLKIYEPGTGQVYSRGGLLGFQVSGQTVTFPAGTFNKPGDTIILRFEQTQGQAFDSSDKNGSLLAANNLGSSDPTIDKSVAGLGIILQRPDGVKRMITIDNNDNIVIKSVP
jgi:hypothetical protein